MQTGNGGSGGGAQSSLSQYWVRWRLGDWCVLAVFGVGVGLLQLLTPHHRLFTANDPTLSFPKLTETVSTGLLFFLAFVIPLLALIAFLALRKNWSEFRSGLLGLGSSLIFTLFVTEAIKRSAGFPRPNFYAYSGYDAATGEFTASASAVKDAFQSFPSGHASTAFAGLGYLSVFLFGSLFPITAQALWGTIGGAIGSASAGAGGGGGGGGRLLDGELPSAAASGGAGGGAGVDSKQTSITIRATAAGAADAGHAAAPNSGGVSADDKSKDVPNPLTSGNHLWKVVSAISPLAIAIFIAVSRTVNYYHTPIDIVTGAGLGLTFAILSYRHYFVYCPPAVKE